MHAVVGDQAEQILRDCEPHAAYANDNDSSLLWRFSKSHRQTLFELLDEIRLATTSRDPTVADALAFLRSNWTSRRDRLELDPLRPLDLSWVPDKYADSRNQLVPWTKYARDVAGYGEQVGQPMEGRAFVADLKDHLARIAAEADASFPAKEHLRIEAGEPVLGRLPRLEEPQDVRELEQRIAERIEPLDVLVDTENRLNWTRFFRPSSGHDAKFDASRARYVATAFCYGCNLGPSQTARSLEG